MTLIPTTQERVQHAAGLAAILDAAYDAFEDMLRLLRAHEDPASGLFPAVMMAAASAADGRDAIAFAPSLPPGSGKDAPAAQDAPQAGDSAETAVDAVAEVSRLLAARLAQAGDSAADPGDQVACSDAARCAQDMYGFLRRSGP